MKNQNIWFDIPDYKLSSLKAPIRSKEDVISRLMDMIDIFSNSPERTTENSSFDQILLHIGGSKRFFVFFENHFYSIVCPFTIEEDKLELFFRTESIYLNTGITSFVKGYIAIGEENAFSKENLKEYSLSLTDSKDLIRTLLTFSDGYLRYDYDKEHADKILHPLNHLDLYYTNTSQIKLGLPTRLRRRKFIEIVEIEAPCAYLK